MTKRTYRLPPNIDQALAKHAEARNTKPSAIVRDALAAYLVIEGTTHRINLELGALREELRLDLLMLKEQISNFNSADRHVGTRDRVTARFEQIINKEKSHGNRNR